MQSKNNLEIQKKRFKEKVGFAESHSAIHVGIPVRSWEIDCVLGELSQGDIVADIGCGVGRFTSEVVSKAQMISTLYCIDLSEDMLANAKKRKQEGRFGKIGVEFYLEDYHNLSSIKPNSINVAILRFAIHHSDNPQKLLSEIKRVLTPNGKLLIIEVENFKNSMAHSFFNKLNSIREPSDEHFYSKRELVGLLNTSGYSNILHKRKSYSICIEDWLINYLSPNVTIPMILESPQKIKRAFHLEKVDNKHTVILNNQFIVAHK